MPKQPSIPLQAIQEAVREEKHAIITDPLEPQIAVPKSDVWSRIADRFDNKITSKNVYTIVKSNRYDTWSILGIKNFRESQPLSVSSQPDVTSDNCDPSSDDSKLELNLTITLSAEEWQLIEPSETTHKNKGIHKSKHSSSRTYDILKPFSWTHVINEHFWSHTKLPCTLKFKRSKVTPNGVNYVNIVGNCIECESTFTGVVYSKPVTNTRVLVNCQYNGDFHSIHSSRSKRNISGSLRECIQQQLCGENKSATSYQRFQAKDLMEFGDYEPAHLPNLNQLRLARSQGFKKSRLDEDVILAIQKAKYSPPTLGIIRDIGCDRFFVHYWSNAQMHVYKAYCRNTDISKISIDATGGVVCKIHRPDGFSSGHIFLYEVTVCDNFSQQQYSVCNMLSERHDANSIYFWLNQWVRDGAQTLKEIVTDMSLALLSAVTQAFTCFKSLADYIRECGKILFGQSTQLHLPGGFIRCDVAHTMKNIADWPCLRGRAKRIRRFYIRVMAQIIQCTDMKEMRILVQAVTTVASSETEGVKIMTQEPTPCETAKELLKTKIAIGKFTDDEADVFLQSCEDAEMVDRTDEQNEILPQELVIACQPFKTWCEEITLSCSEMVEHVEGDRDNLQYLPELVKPLANLMQKMPLVTAIMVPCYGFGEVTCSSSSVESSFNDVKNRMCSRNLPIRADEFLSIHIGSIEGKMRLAAAPNRPQYNNSNQKLKQPFDEKQSVKETVDKPINENVSDVKAGNSYDEALNTGNSSKQEFKTGNSSEEDNIQTGNSSDDALKPGKPAEEELKPSKSSEEETENELKALENWRNQAMIPPKKRKKSRYLDSKIEWLHLDLSLKVDPSKVIGVLKNGHRPGLQAIKCGEIYISLANTCAFDSIAQILCVAYCDSDNYKHFVDRHNDSLNELVKGMTTHGVTSATYRLRALLMKKALQGVTLPSGILHINGETHAAAMATSLFSDHPSAKEEMNCSTGKKCHHGNKSFTLRTVQVHFESPKMDAHTLQAKINSQLLGEETACASESSQCKCLGVRTSVVSSVAPHLIMEPTCMDLSRKNTDIMDVFYTNVGDFPRTILVASTTYTFRGIVAHVGNIRTRQSVGHYTAYCLRRDDKWQVFDDLRDKVQHSSENNNVNCHLVVYTI